MPNYAVIHDESTDENSIPSYPGYQTYILRIKEKFHFISFSTDGRQIIRPMNMKIINININDEPIIIRSSDIYYSFLIKIFPKCTSFNLDLFYIEPQNIQDQVFCGVLLQMQDEIGIQVKDASRPLICQENEYNSFLSQNPNIFSTEPFIYKIQNSNIIFFDNDNDYSLAKQNSSFYTVWFNRKYEFYAPSTPENSSKLNQSNIPHFQFKDIIYISIQDEDLGEFPFISKFSLDDYVIDPSPNNLPSVLKFYNAQSITREVVRSFNKEFCFCDKYNLYFYYSSEEDRFQVIYNLVYANKNKSNIHFDILFNYPKKCQPTFFIKQLKHLTYVFQSRQLFSTYMNETRTAFCVIYLNQESSNEFKNLNSMVFNGTIQMYEYPLNIRYDQPFFDSHINFLYILDKDQIHWSEQDKEQYIFKLINPTSTLSYEHAPSIITYDHAMCYVQFHKSNKEAPKHFKSILESNKSKATGYLLGNFNPSFLRQFRDKLQTIFPEAISIDITCSFPEFLVLVYPNDSLIETDLNNIDDSYFIRGKKSYVKFTSNFLITVSKYIHENILNERGIYYLPYSPDLNAIILFFHENGFYDYSIFGIEYHRYTEHMFISISGKERIAKKFFKNFKVPKKNLFPTQF